MFGPLRRIVLVAPASLRSGSVDSNSPMDSAPCIERSRVVVRPAGRTASFNAGVPSASRGLGELEKIDCETHIGRKPSASTEQPGVTARADRVRHWYFSTVALSHHGTGQSQHGRQ
jgi:hypothetical protein